MRNITRIIAIATIVCFCFTGFPLASGSLDSYAATNKITAKAVKSGHTVKVSWNKVAKPYSGYAVFRNGKCIKKVGKKTTSFTSKNLKDGKYRYVVRTYKVTKKTQWYNKKTKKWVSKKPAKKYRGKARKVKVYSYKAKSNAVTVTVNTVYTITWKMDDGKVLKTEKVVKGKTPAYTGETPQKAEDTTYTYTFKGWEPEVKAATANATYTAQFTAEPKNTFTKIKVKWLNYDGSLVRVSFHEKGEMPQYPQDKPLPSRPEDDEYTYTFTGWSPALVPVTEETRYKAQYKAVKKEGTPEPTSKYHYDIKFINEPYGNGGDTAVYIKTDNPNKSDLSISVLDSNGNKTKAISSYGIQSSISNYRDMGTLTDGYVAILSPDYAGNGAIAVYEWNDTLSKDVKVASRNVRIQDFEADEQVYLQSVINEVTTPNMTNKEKMHAICNYILSNFNYEKYDGNHYVSLVVDAGRPYWISKETNSATSPAMLVKFGKLIGYPLKNMYPVYEYGTPEWKTFHSYAYSEADDEWYFACPDNATGIIDLNTIQMFDPDTYHFWGE